MFFLFLFLHFQTYATQPIKILKCSPGFQEAHSLEQGQGFDLSVDLTLNKDQASLTLQYGHNAQTLIADLEDSRKLILKPESSSLYFNWGDSPEKKMSLSLFYVGARKWNALFESSTHLQQNHMDMLPESLLTCDETSDFEAVFGL